MASCERPKAHTDLPYIRELSEKHAGLVMAAAEESECIELYHVCVCVRESICTCVCVGWRKKQKNERETIGLR